MDSTLSARRITAANPSTPSYVCAHANNNIRQVNTMDDELSQLATTFNSTEIALFRQIVEMVMTDRNGRLEVSTTEAMNAGRQLHRDGKSGQLSNAQIEQLFDRFVRDRWLDRSRQVLIYLNLVSKYFLDFSVFDY